MNAEVLSETPEQTPEITPAGKIIHYVELRDDVKFFDNTDTTPFEILSQGSHTLQQAQAILLNQAPCEFPEDSAKYNADDPSENEVILLYCEAVDPKIWVDIPDVDPANLKIGIFISSANEIVAGFVVGQDYEVLHLPGMPYELVTLRHTAKGMYRLVLKAEQFLIEQNDNTVQHQSIEVSLLRSLVMRDEQVELLHEERDDLYMELMRKLSYFRYLDECEVRKKVNELMQSPEEMDPLEILALKMHFKGTSQDLAEMLLKEKKNPYDRRTPEGRKKDAEIHVKAILHLIHTQDSPTLAALLPANDNDTYLMLCGTRFSELMLVVTEKPKTGVVQVIGHPVYLTDLTMADFDFIDCVMRFLPDEFESDYEKTVWNSACISILHNFFFYRSRMPYIYNMDRRELTQYVYSKYLRSVNQHCQNDSSGDSIATENKAQENLLKHTEVFCQQTGLDLSTLLQYVLEPSLRPFPDFEPVRGKQSIQIATLSTDPYEFRCKALFGSLVSLLCIIDINGDVCIALFDEPDTASPFEGDFFSDWIKIKGSSPETYQVFSVVLDSQQLEDDAAPGEQPLFLFLMLKHIDEISGKAAESIEAGVEFAQSLLEGYGCKMDCSTALARLQLQEEVVSAMEA